MWIVSWDSWAVHEQCVNSTFCLLHSKFMYMNSMGYCSYTLKKKKKKQTLNLKCGSKQILRCGLDWAYLCLRFTLSRFFLFFFYTRSWFHVGDRPTSGYRAQCTGPISTLDIHTLVWNGTICGSYALFTGPTNIFFHPNFNYKWVPQHYSHI